MKRYMIRDDRRRDKGEEESDNASDIGRISDHPHRTPTQAPCDLSIFAYNHILLPAVQNGAVCGLLSKLTVYLSMKYVSAACENT